MTPEQTITYQARKIEALKTNLKGISRAKEKFEFLAWFYKLQWEKTKSCPKGEEFNLDLFQIFCNAIPLLTFAIGFIIGKHS